jgi:uncharacterized protein (TIGR02246 family)
MFHLSYPSARSCLFWRSIAEAAIEDLAMSKHRTVVRASLAALAAASFAVAGTPSVYASAATGWQPGKRIPPTLLDTLVRLERRALDRWIRLDPDGYLDLYADDATYFDPTVDNRVDGLPALRARIDPIRRMKAPFTDPRYEMIAPRVQQFGDAAVLTFNIVNYAKVGGKPETVLNRWNSTEVYARSAGKWRLVHSHWSYTKPEIKRPAGCP